jgi:hypothetical protein
MRTMNPIFMLLFEAWPVQYVFFPLPLLQAT